MDFAGVEDARRSETGSVASWPTTQFLRQPRHRRPITGALDSIGHSAEGMAMRGIACQGRRVTFQGSGKILVVFQQESTRVIKIRQFRFLH